MTKARWIVGLCAVAMLGVVGCSSDDVADVLGIDPEGEAAEAAVEAALNDIVDPIVTLMDLVFSLSGGVAAPGEFSGISCPDTSMACASGTLDCSLGKGGLDFFASSCVVSDGETTATLNGTISVDFSGSTFTLSNVTVDGSTPLNGTISFSGKCDTSWDISTVDGTVIGNLTVCGDHPETGSSVVVTVDGGELGTWGMTFSFNGTNIATAIITLDQATYATCDSINLDTYAASCSGA